MNSHDSASDPGMAPTLFFGLMAAMLPAADAPTDPAAPVVRGEVRFVATDAEREVPEPFRSADHTFPFEVRRTHDLKLSGVEVSEVRFPSPVTTPHPANNTVHCELFRPTAPGKHPAVVVLDILDGRAMVSRGEAMWLAQHGVTALVVWMPYYGARRPAEGGHRMLSPDVDRSLGNVRQTVLDCRRAVAWLAAQPGVDADRLGIVGTSLGSFLGALTGAAEPRLKTVCLLLGGGGLVDAFYDHPKARLLTQGLKLIGITKETLRALIAPADPLTYADRLKGKRLLLIAASRDDVVPPAATTRLWEATGRPKILWFDATHVGAAAYAFPAMNAVLEHIKE